MARLSYVGKNVTRLDVHAKSTGEATYTADLFLPGMLFGRFLRSPLPHARIRGVRTERAGRVKGVKAVITGADAPYKFGVSHYDQTPLAVDKVRHIGDPVAAVAATDLDAAEEALSLIEVDYEELPAVFHPEEAMEPGAPLIHEDKERNIAAHIQYEAGDVEEALRRAAHVFEDRFETQRQAHLCMEPHVCVAHAEPSGKVTFYYSTQAPSYSRSQMAKVLHVPESHIRIVTHNVGGGFGSKATGKFCMDFCAIQLSRVAGRPVKIEHTRDEEFQYATFRHPFVVHLRTGLDKDGILLGRDVRVVMDNGGYCDYGPVVCNVAGALGGTLYRFPNYRYDGYVVYTNNIFGGAMRGLGNPQITFACETQLNQIADSLGMDPLELRLKNAVRTGDEAASGALFRSCALSECLSQVAENIGWKEKGKRKDGNRGIGLACGVHFVGVRLSPGIDADFAGASITLNDDGSIHLATSVCEIGNGSSTVLAQMAAEVLGVPMEKITVIYGDTDVTPMGWGSRASRNTAIGGMAVQQAAGKVRDQVFEVAARMLEASPEDLDIGDERVFVKGAPERALSLSDAVKANRYRRQGQAIWAQAHYDAPSELADKQTGRGNFASAFAFGAKAVEVEVDPETGEVRILRVVSASDIGKVISPNGAQGQVEGGYAQSLGFTLMEEICCQEGQVTNPNLIEYKVPTTLDLTRVEGIFIESDDPLGPWGAKGIGEMVTVDGAPAIVAAVHDAVGVWVNDLPVTPDKLWRALGAGGEGA
ncbi:MAG: xanthine dehydrogenase family protein molybdopterin-binding subunit [Nitrospinota bacterium]